ncbi:hypothetical protein [Kallotenue papyrolyticum]|uniref:hypothetical protein n=1 Tax=Kallotenue papyrolyticum TaxID=1325125 RepID=UPI0004785B4D|nr:hypothetical protein [Kallotenue papyrolyticum]
MGIGLLLLLCLGSALWQLQALPWLSGMLLVAAMALAWLLNERISTRRSLIGLAERLRDERLPKVESAGLVAAVRLDQALNQALQRRRTEVAHARPAPAPALPPLTMVVVLGIGLRLEPGMTYSPHHLVRLDEVVQRAQQWLEHELLIHLEGDGTALLVLRVAARPAVAARLQQALELARSLAADRTLRFGLSCGDAMILPRATAEPLIIGAPLEDAARLARMAVAWHEYQLLCSEPVALLARHAAGQRTELRLTHPGAPPLPVYALDLCAAAVARSA